MNKAAAVPLRKAVPRLKNKSIDKTAVLYKDSRFYVCVPLHGFREDGTIKPAFIFERSDTTCQLPAAI